MKCIKAWEPQGPLIFMGEEVVARTWTPENARRAGYSQWTDIILYRIDDPAWPDWAYGVQITGRSVLYHGDGGCSRGVRMPVASILNAVDPELYVALEPCTKPGCTPPDLDLLDDDVRVSVEVNRYTWIPCESAVQVVEQLRQSGKALMHSVLEAAVQIDPLIAQAAESVKRH